MLCYGWTAPPVPPSHPSAPQKVDGFGLHLSASAESFQSNFCLMRSDVLRAVANRVTVDCIKSITVVSNLNFHLGRTSRPDSDSPSRFFFVIFSPNKVVFFFFVFFSFIPAGFILTVQWIETGQEAEKEREGHRHGERWRRRANGRDWMIEMKDFPFYSDPSEPLSTSFGTNTLVSFQLTGSNLLKQMAIWSNL